MLPAAIDELVGATVTPVDGTFICSTLTVDLLIVIALSPYSSLLAAKSSSFRTPTLTLPYAASLLTLKVIVPNVTSSDPVNALAPNPVNV